MNNSLKIYIFILVILMAGIIYVDATRPKPINWSPSFAINDKIPFGLHVFNEEVEFVFKNQKIIKKNETPYEYLYPKYNYTDSSYVTKSDLMYINENFDIDQTSLDEIFYYIQRGHTILISCSNFPENLKDSLHFDTTYTFDKADSIALFTAAEPSKEYFTEKLANFEHFKINDSTNATILGFQKVSNQEKKPNFIAIPYGKGHFILHNQPQVFTNYYLLREDISNYTSKICSYLNSSEITWFSKYYENDTLNQSPMRYILKQPALKWAWQLSLLAVVLFMVFNAKRKQRIIPILEPERNTTVDFAKTIGNLYYIEGNHHNLIEKKIVFLLEKIRNEYFLDTRLLDDSFIQKLHVKSNRPKDKINQLVQLINHYKKQNSATENELIALNQIIEELNL